MKTLSSDEQKSVLDSAVQLFTHEDLDNISLDQLAKSSGVPAFDIIRHYTSRENILTAVLERELDLMAGAAHSPELRMPGETLKDELHVMGEVILQEYRLRLPLLGRLMAVAMQNPEAGALFYRTFIVQGRMLFTEFLNSRAKLGELRADLDMEAAAAIFLSALTGPLLLTELFGGKRVEHLDDARLLSELSNVFIEGVTRR